MYDDLTCSEAWLEPAGDAPLPGGPWAYRLFVGGSGFVNRAVGLYATVGDMDVELIMISPGGGGFTGFLREAPAEGAALRVGWMTGPLIETGIVFNPPGDA